MSQKIYSDRTELEGVELPSAGQTRLLVVDENKKIKSEVNGGGAGVRPDLYINGSLVTTSDASSGTYVAMENLNVPLMFGKNPDTTSFSLNGKMCEISIWNKALSAGEISDIYDKNINGDGLLD